MPDRRSPMPQRRAEELALIFLKLIFAIEAKEVEEFSLPEGFSEKEFFELLEIIAPRKMAEIERECSREIDLSDILEGASRKFREQNNARLLAGISCPVCGQGKLEYPTENGIFDLSGSLLCPKCNRDFPSH